MWLERIREVMADFGDNVAIEEIDISEHPEVLKKYPSRVWQEFLDGYIHYVTIIAVNGKVSENWYWDVREIAEAVRQEIGSEKKPE